jgi:hypothetical protein
MPKVNTQGFNPHDGTAFGTEAKSPLDDATVREVTESARSLDPDDDRAHFKVLLDDVVDESKILDLLASEVTLTTHLFMAEHYTSCYTPASRRASDSGLVEVALRHRPVAIEGVGDAYIDFDIKADPETLEIRRMGVSIAFVAETRRRLVEEGLIDW